MNELSKSEKEIYERRKGKLEEILKTLSTDNDLIWPNEKWPAMKFKGGIKVGLDAREVYF